MFLNNCVKELIIALEKQNDFDLKLALIRLRYYLWNPSQRDDKNHLNEPITNEEIAFKLKQQLCEWHFGLDIEEDERSFITYLNDNSKNENLSKEIRSSISYFKFNQ